MPHVYEVMDESSGLDPTYQVTVETTFGKQVCLLVHAKDEADATHKVLLPAHCPHGLTIWKILSVEPCNVL
jgi:hypothetical protein